MTIVTRAICLLVLCSFSTVSVARRGGGRVFSDTASSSQQLDRAQQRMSDVQESLNRTQRDVIQNYQDQQIQVQQALTSREQERLDNATDALASALSPLTPEQRQVFDENGLGQALQDAGVTNQIIEAIRKALNRRETIISGLTLEQQRIVKSADAARRNASHILGRDKLRQWVNAKLEQHSAFRALNVSGLSDRKKSLAGRAELEMDKFVCGNLTKYQRKLRRHASHVRRSFERDLDKDVLKKLKNAEEKLEKVLAKLNPEQRNAFNTGGIEKLKTVITDLKLVANVTKRLNDLSVAKGALSDKEKENLNRAEDAMKNFTRSLPEPMRKRFMKLNRNLKSAYNNMTRAQANTLKLKLNSILESQCIEEDKQGVIDTFRSWLKDATPEQMKNSLRRLKNEMKQLQEEEKLVERMLQANARALNIGNHSKSRCMLHYEESKGRMNVINDKGKDSPVVYFTEVLDGGDITWQQVTDGDDIKDMLANAKKEEAREVKISSGATWKLSSGKIELQKIGSESFSTVGVCQCDGCEEIPK